MLMDLLTRTSIASYVLFTITSGLDPVEKVKRILTYVDVLNNVLFFFFSLHACFGCSFKPVVKCMMLQ